MTNIRKSNKFVAEQWAATYLPVKNPKNRCATHKNITFETFGDDLAWIGKQLKEKSNHVWTMMVMDVDEDTKILVSGFHVKNPIGYVKTAIAYYFTEIPHDGSDIEIIFEFHHEDFHEESVFDQLVDELVSLEQAYEAYERIKEEGIEYDQNPGSFPSEAEHNETVKEISKQLDVSPETLLVAIEVNYWSFDDYRKTLAAEQLAEEYNPCLNTSQGSKKTTTV